MSFGANEMMMDLFRSEVESHTEVLSNSLLKLERDPSDTSVYDSMMRAAHSIKGAARIVQVNAAVEVSHVLEDCFVAAQRGELQIRPSDFDLLLRSVDLLVRISEATKDAEPQLDDLSGDVHDCVKQLKDLRAGQPHSATDSPSRRASVPTAAPVSVSLQRPEASPTATADVPSVPNPAFAPPAHQETHVSPAATRSLVLECGISFGRIDAEEMRKVLLRELKSDVGEVRFDLLKTVDIDPIGLAFLSAAKLHVEKNSFARLRFSPVSDKMQVVLRVAGITQS